MTGILTLVTVLAGWALSYTYTLTKPIIEANREKKKSEMISNVLPPFNNRPEREAVILKNDKGERMTFYVGKQDGKPTGVAFIGNAQGYSGNISIMIGVTPEGKVYGINILNQNETPGLGNKIVGKGYLNQFQGKDISGYNWDVKKRGGDFDQITAATVSSRAVTKGIKESLLLYQAQAERILKKGKSR